MPSEREDAAIGPLRSLLTLLVEDDGVGAAMPSTRTEHPGEHVGLLIREERAQRLGSTLCSESEPGEGTGIELKVRSRVEAAVLAVEEGIGSRKRRSAE